MDMDEIWRTDRLQCGTKQWQSFIPVLRFRGEIFKYHAREAAGENLPARPALIVHGQSRCFKGFCRY